MALHLSCMQLPRLYSRILIERVVAVRRNFLPPLARAMVRRGGDGWERAGTHHMWRITKQSQFGTKVI